MSISIQPYTEDLEEAVKAFNTRLRDNGIQMHFPESHTPDWLPPLEDRTLFQDFFCAVDDQQAVRGAYILKHQDFMIQGEPVSIGAYQLPISEGTIDKKYNFLGIQLLSNALKRQPLLYGLGMGGYGQAITKLLKAMRWSMYTVPFLFKVKRPQTFLKEIAFLRQSPSRRRLLDLGYFTGLGWLGINILQAYSQKHTLKRLDCSWTRVEQFTDWADDLWLASNKAYALVAVRNSHTLNILYPAHSKRFIRLKVVQNHRIIGWAVVLDTHMTHHKQFGNMRVGSIIDCLSLPKHAHHIMAAATSYLEEAGVDMIVSNQSHVAWVTALKNSGFIQGPSNFVFATSVKLTGHLAPFDVHQTMVHMNRGDGDGPINL